MTMTTSSAIIERLNTVKEVMEAIAGVASRTDLKAGAEGIDAISETMEAVVSRISDVMPEYDMETSSSVDRATGEMSFTMKGTAEGRGIDGKFALDPETGTLKGTFKANCLKGTPSLAVNPEGCPNIVGAALRAAKRFVDMVDSYDVAVSYEQNLFSGDVSAKVDVDMALMGRYAKTVEASYSRVDGRETTRVKSLKRKSARSTGAEGSSSETAA